VDATGFSKTEGEGSDGFCANKTGKQTFRRSMQTNPAGESNPTLPREGMAFSFRPQMFDAVWVRIAT
jgi:hypothetical protein